MNTIDPLLLQFWGKTPKMGDSVERFHPAVFHMLDVALVAEALLRDGAPRLRQSLIHAWRGCDPEALIAWLPFLIATHDLGKISAAFQGQAEPQRERLAQAGVPFSAKKPNLYHAEISALWLHQELQHREAGVSDTLMWALRDAMGGHHGRFTEADMKAIRQRLRESERSESRWSTWREQCYALLRELLAPPGDLAAIGSPDTVRPATVALTGFIVWCDWMGSNEHDFPATPGLAPDAYLVLCRTRASRALDLHRLRASRLAPQYRDFQSVFPDIGSPRPLQGLIDTLPGVGLEAPSLTVIEAPTGEGKTEAALALARRIAAARGIDEIFFALPTMATGNQMFTRLERLYQQLYPGQGAVRLTHSQAFAIEDDLRRRVAFSPDDDAGDPDGRSADAALEWFAGAKKAMLAPFGVGTVDQVELGGLNVRHYPLRLFGLAGKVVVIDEVHAYDAYMSAILDHTLTWLAGLGCSVILLSATLPAGRHRALAAAFLDGLPQAIASDREAPYGRSVLRPNAPGASNEPPAPELPTDLPYPALSFYRADAAHRTSCAVFRGEQRFTLRLAAQRAAEEEASFLIDLVRDGGAVARLCNRVDDAQAIYQALINRRFPTDRLVLLHARFPLHMRQKRERQIEDLVGKGTARSGSDPLIIVGTQVLEQSLDYDVDVMISDFAPIDLLLQRAGRLHRHSRAGKRPARHAEPALEVTLPQDDAGTPDWDRWAPIYNPYILWRTLATLREGMLDEQRTIALPGDYRPLIEAVYGDETPTGIYANFIIQAYRTYRTSIDEQQAKARVPLIPAMVSNDAITEDGGRAFIEDEAGQAASWQLAKTRLGDRVTLVPVYAGDGELFLDPHGSIRLSPDTPPDLDQQKDMLNHAVPISNRRIIAAYRDDRRDRTLRWPWPEREIPALVRSLHPLRLNRHTHSATIAGHTLRLDPNLGLVITRDHPVSYNPIEEDL